MYCKHVTFNNNKGICPPYVYHSSSDNYFGVASCGVEFARHRKAYDAVLHGLYLYHVLLLEYAHGKDVCEFLNVLARSVHLGPTLSRNSLEKYNEVKVSVAKSNDEYLTGNHDYHYQD